MPRIATIDDDKEGKTVDLSTADGFADGSQPRLKFRSARWLKIESAPTNAIGKRFGRLKKKLGFGLPHVFHSIRKTVTTQMENGGIAEGIAADIVGHEKATITYGLYSAGTTTLRKYEAIKLIRYPGA